MVQHLRRLFRDHKTLRAGALRVAALVKSLHRAEPGLYTLLYHRVPASSQEAFDRQLGFFRQFGRFVAPEEATALVRGGWTGRHRAFLLSFDDGQADNIDVALPVLRARSVPAIQFLVSDWVDGPPPSTGRADGYMTRDDVAAWVAAGMSLGSHSATHPRLSGLDAAAVRAEFERSRDTLGRMAGEPMRHFACPWGVAGADYVPDRDPALARACGFETFFTTRRGSATDRSDLLAMPRHVLEPHWPLHEIEALMGGWTYGRPTP